MTWSKQGEPKRLRKGAFELDNQQENIKMKSELEGVIGNENYILCIKYALLIKIWKGEEGRKNWEVGMMAETITKRGMCEKWRSKMTRVVK